MYKTARIFLTLLVAALLLPACTRKQAPTPSDRGTGLGDRGSMSGGLGDDLIPAGPANGFGIDGIDGDLELRDGNAGISNGKYNGMDMVEGLLPSVYFGFDSSSISGAERSKLQQAADHLNSNPSDQLLIEGHCDWYGTAEYNIALGERRANSAREYVIALGIAANRVHTLSKGSLESTSGLSKDQSGQDRRADLIVLK